MNPVRVAFQRIDPELPLPSYAHPGDAGMDLRSTVDVTLLPFQRALIPTGFAVAIPEGFAGFIHPRSGSALKRGLSIPNAPGTVDSGFRGELMVIMINLDPDTPIVIERGERIAQLVIQEIVVAQPFEALQLNATNRGEGGFGSTGFH